MKFPAATNSRAAHSWAVDKLKDGSGNLQREASGAVSTHKSGSQAASSCHRQWLAIGNHKHTLQTKSLVKQLWISCKQQKSKSPIR